MVVVSLAAVNKLFPMMTLMMALVQHCMIGLRLRDEILTEFCAALVNRHSVTYNSGRTSGRIRESAALHPGVLEVWYTVDSVE